MTNIQMRYLWGMTLWPLCWSQALWNPFSDDLWTPMPMLRPMPMAARRGETLGTAMGPLLGDMLRGLLLVGVLAGECGAPPVCPSPGSRARGEQEGPEVLRPKGGARCPRLAASFGGKEAAEDEVEKREVAEGLGTLELAHAPSTMRRRGMLALGSSTEDSRGVETG